MKNGTHNKRLKAIAALLAMICLGQFIYIAKETNAINRILSKAGLVRYEDNTLDLIARGWNNCLSQLDYDVDIVFLGDSLTAGNDWQDSFPEYNVVNLGLSGDRLYGMTYRAEVIQELNPKLIFVMGGLNGLSKHNIEFQIEQYDILLDLLKEGNPECRIIIQSILPVANSQEKKGLSNEAIREMNVGIEGLCKKKDVEYLDLHALFTNDDGSLQSEFTKDGIHLTEDGYREWEQAILKMLL